MRFESWKVQAHELMGLPDVQLNQPTSSPLIEEKKTKKRILYKKQKRGEARSAGAEGCRSRRRRYPLLNREQLLPDSHRAFDDFHEIRSLNHPGIGMLRKAVVAFIACAALYLAFSAYSRRQVRLSVLQFVWSGSVVRMSD
jgi:hypothetical protein